ncbi:hypothetical protein V2J09_022851 [Rumex salicifolius]
MGFLGPSCTWARGESTSHYIAKHLNRLHLTLITTTKGSGDPSDLRQPRRLIPNSVNLFKKSGTRRKRHQELYRNFKTTYNIGTVMSLEISTNERRGPESDPPTLWRQKSREQWLASRDRITPFYRLSTVRKRNRFEGLKNVENEIITNNTKMEEMTLDFFRSLCTLPEAENTPFTITRGRFPILDDQTWRDPFRKKK